MDQANDEQNLDFIQNKENSHIDDGYIKKLKTDLNPDQIIKMREYLEIGDYQSLQKEIEDFSVRYKKYKKFSSRFK